MYLLAWIVIGGSSAGEREEFFRVMAIVRLWTSSWASVAVL
jgi:hypothetical protein